MQAIEIGDAVHPEQHRLAVDGELALLSFPRSLDDPREALGVVVTAPRHHHKMRTSAEAPVLKLLSPKHSRQLVAAIQLDEVHIGGVGSGYLKLVGVIDTAPRAGDARILAGASKCD